LQKTTKEKPQRLLPHKEEILKHYWNTVYGR